MRPIVAVVAAGLTITLFGGCGLFGKADVDPSTPATIEVSSPAFGAGGRIPSRYTCQGTDIPPPLRWSGVPSRAGALALVVDDPDAPEGTFVHWVLYNLTPGTTSLAASKIPAQAREARNSAGKATYTGPCPPDGPHHYRFTLYALRQPIPLPDGARLKAVLADISKRAVAHGRLIGVFGN